LNGCSSIRITDAAQDDLLAGFWFYQTQLEGLGAYFLDSLMADIDSLIIHAGVHVNQDGIYRSLGSRFPYAIYYLLQTDVVTVIAVLDTRRDPVWMRARLGSNS
jgi:plasmid stabilization system protein ParE